MVGTAVVGTAVAGTAVVGTAVVGTAVVGTAVVGTAVVGTDGNHDTAVGLLLVADCSWIWVGDFSSEMLCPCP